MHYNYLVVHLNKLCIFANMSMMTLDAAQILNFLHLAYFTPK